MSTSAHLDSALITNRRVSQTIPVGIKASDLLYQHLLNGADRDMDVDGSSTPVNFLYTTPAARITFISHIHIMIEDAKVDPTDFGGLTALTTGVDFKVYDSDDTVLKDFCDGFPLKTNAELSILAGANITIETGTGDDALLAEMDIEHSGVILRMTAGQYIQVTIRDDLRALTKFFMFLQGYELDVI